MSETVLKKEHLEHYVGKKCNHTCPHVPPAVKDSYTIWFSFFDSKGEFKKDVQHDQCNTTCSHEYAERHNLKSTYMYTESVSLKEDGNFLYKKWVDKETFLANKL